MARNPFRGRVVWPAVCLLSLLTARALAAQTEPAPEAGGGGPATGSQSSPGGQPPATQVPMVVSAVSSDKGHPNRAGLGDGLTVTVKSLRTALANVKDGCNGLILFLNDIPIHGVPPESCSLATGNVHFTLDRTDDSDKAWHILLEEPIAFNKLVSVSLGPEGDLSFPTNVDHFELEVLPQLQLLIYFACMFVFLMLCYRLATRTPLMRDRNAMTPAGKLPPYSLSRFQLAFWSILVVAAYLFIWLITKELDTITGSVLALLGIGSATALGAKLIDTGKTSAAAGDGQQAQPALAPPPTKVAVSQGFLHDVLSDAEGISLYRFQLFVWTWVLGVIFVASVYNGLQMPQFNPTLLGLMGISSGTYLGFKVPESRGGTE
jgi:hypothetical protein